MLFSTLFVLPSLALALPLQLSKRRDSSTTDVSSPSTGDSTTPVTIDVQPSTADDDGAGSGAEGKRLLSFSCSSQSKLINCSSLRHLRYFLDSLGRLVYRFDSLRLYRSNWIRPFFVVGFYCSTRQRRFDFFRTYYFLRRRRIDSLLLFLRQR